MAFEFEPSNPFTLAASPSTPSEPAQQASDVQAQQTPQTMPEQRPFGWTDWAKKSAMKNGDYFEHDNKIFNQRDGKTFLVTGDGMGDVELDEGQAGQLAKEREDKAARENAEKDGPVYTDQVPSGSVESGEYTSPEVGPNGKRADSWFNRQDPRTRQAIAGGVSGYVVKRILGDEAGLAVGIWAADKFREADEKIPELEKK